MTAPPTLRVLLLGTPVILAGDQPLQIQRRLIRWLLFYLACQKEMVGRSDLILLFWPDEPEESARRHLREILSKLRAQLPDPTLIITEQDQVGLDQQRVSSDVLTFQALFAQTSRACAQTPATTPLTQAVHQRVVDAVRLWRSARFMAGVSLPESENLNDWLLSTSQQLETQRARLLERLVDHDIASGDTESAINWLQTALEGDETNESLHYRMLNLLHKQARYSEALNYCTYLQEVFRREGYSELPPSLLRLSRQIREEADQPVSETGRPSWPSLADMQVPFVGRQAILRDLQLAVRRGSPIILFGEAGSGKSRLVRELFFSLKPAPRLLLATAWMKNRQLPLQPIVDMLRRDIQAEEWKQMDRVWVTPLSLLLPELTIMRPEIQPPRVNPEQERGLIFEALHQLFLFIGKKQRILLFLDNAQWSDEETFSALAYLAERGLPGENGAIILAARPEEPAPFLSDFLNRPRSPFTIQRFHLPLMDAEETSALARYALGDAFNEEIVPRLLRETGGNPLFLLDTLRLVLDYALAQNRPAAGRNQEREEPLPLAGTVYAVIRERLQNLTPNDAQVLNIAAVIGNEFSTDILESTCMLPPEQVAQSLDSLAQVNLIKAVLRDRPSSEYTFVHEKVREVILLDLSPARKRLFHLRIARALDQKPEGQSAEMEALLARHFEEAGELNAAHQHWLRTSLYAWRNSEPDQAVQALKNAEQILQRLGSQASDISIYQLYRQWGRLAYHFSDPEMMAQIFERLLEYGQNRQNPLLTGTAYIGFAQVAELRKAPRQGMAYLDKAAPFLDQAGRLFEHIEARNYRGIFLVQTAQYREAQSVFEKAMTLGERVSDAQGIEARSLTEYWQAVLLMLQGWPGLALEMAERSIQDAEEAFSPFGVLRGVSIQATARAFLGQYQESLADAIQGSIKAAKMASPFLEGEFHGVAAQGSLATGDLDGCWRHLQAALENAQRYPFSFLKEAALCLKGDLYAFMGDDRAAMEAYQEGSQGGLENYHALTCRLRYSAAQAKQGDTQQALEQIEECIRFALQHGLMLFHLAGQATKAQVLVNMGCQEEARQILDFCTAEARLRGLPETEIQSMVMQAQLDLLENRLEDSEITGRRAADMAAEIGSVPLEVSACRVWMEARARAGLETQEPAGRLQNRLHSLSERTRTAAFRELLTELQESVDRKA